MGLSNSKDPLKNIYPKKIKGKNICFYKTGWDCFFWNKKRLYTVEREPPSESDGGSQGACYAVSLVMRHKHTVSVRPKTKYKSDNMRHQQTLSVRPKTTF